MLKPVWIHRRIPLSFLRCIPSSHPSSCKSGTLTAELQRRIWALELRCYHRHYITVGFLVLPQNTMHLMQKPCYQQGSLCQDPAGNWTTRRPPDHCKETQTAVVWLCLLFIRSGPNRLARHSEKGKKTRQTEEEVRRQHQGMDRPGALQVPEGSGEQGKMEETGCKIICGAPVTLMVKG